MEKIGLEAILKDNDFVTGMTRYLKYQDTAVKRTENTKGVFSTAFMSMGNSVLSFAGIAAKALFVGAGSVVSGLGTIGILSTKTAIDFQSAWAGVVKTTDGLVDEFGNLTASGEALQRGLRDLAIDTGLTVEELAKIGELGGQLGVSRDAILSFTDAIAAMGVSTNLTTEEAASGFAQIANIMGTVEKEGTEAFEKLGSAIVALGNNSATTERDILAFAQNIAGAGKIAGITEADVFGIAAAFSSVGIEAQAGGTAVQKVILEMSKAVQGSAREADAEWAAALGNIMDVADVSISQVADAVHEGGDALEELARKAGVSADTVVTALSLGMASPGSQTLRDFAEVAGMTADEFKTLFQEDATGAFEAFVAGLGSAGDEAIVLLEELGLSDSRLIRSFLSLSNAGDLLTDSIDLSNNAWEDNNALTNEANQRYKTAQFRINQFKNKIKDAGITIGTALLPFLGDMLDYVGPIIDQFASKLPDFLENNLIPALQRIVEWIGTYLPIALQAASDFWSNVLRPALETFWSYLVSNVFPVISQLVAWFQENLPIAIAFVTEHLEEFKGALIAIGAVLAGAGIVAAIAGIIAALNPVSLAIGAIIAVAGLLGAAWAGNWGGIRDTMTAIWFDTLKPALEELWAWLSVNIPIAIQALSEFWINTLKPALEVVWLFISETLLPILGQVVAWLIEHIPAAIQLASDYWTNVLKPSLEIIWGFISETLIPIIEQVVTWLAENIPTAIETAADYWENTLKPALEAVWDFIDQYILPIFDGVRQVFEETGRIALEGFALLWKETLYPALEDVWKFISENILPILEDVRAFLVDTLGPKIVDFVTNSLTPMANGLEEIKKWLEKVRNWIQKLIDILATFTWGEMGDGALPSSPPKLAQGFAAISKEVDRFGKTLAGNEQYALSYGAALAGLVPGGRSLGDLGMVGIPGGENGVVFNPNGSTGGLNVGIPGGENGVIFDPLKTLNRMNELYASSYGAALAGLVPSGAIAGSGDRIINSGGNKQVDMYFGDVNLRNQLDHENFIIMLREAVRAELNAGG